jgi:hypothetical protein
MAANFSSAVFKAVHAKLNGAIAGLTVYDHVPFEPEGAPDANFPFAVVGDMDVAPWDTDDTRGATVSATVHVWSRYKGRKEARDTLDSIYALLHRAALVAVGYKFVDVLFTFSTITVEGDGKTRHGIIRFQLTVQEN